MAVSALELRPRGAVAILDAALRLCSRHTGVWALTLPGGALVTAATLHMVDAVTHRRSLALPTLWLTLAWLARGVFQGATCHYVQEVLLGQKEPSVLSSLRAALQRMPSLLIAVGSCSPSTPSRSASRWGWPSSCCRRTSSAMPRRCRQGQSPGPVRAVLELLGPARSTAMGVRLMLGVQVLTFFNLHIAINVLFVLGRNLLAIDLTYAERFASLDNPPWLISWPPSPSPSSSPSRPPPPRCCWWTGGCARRGWICSPPCSSSPREARPAPFPPRRSSSCPCCSEARRRGRRSPSRSRSRARSSASAWRAWPRPASTRMRI